VGGEVAADRAAGVAVVVADHPVAAGDQQLYQLIRPAHPKGVRAHNQQQQRRIGWVTNSLGSKSRCLPRARPAQSSATPRHHMLRVMFHLPHDGSRAWFACVQPMSATTNVRTVTTCKPRVTTITGSPGRGARGASHDAGAIRGDRGKTQLLMAPYPPPERSAPFGRCLGRAGWSKPDSTKPRPIWRHRLMGWPTSGR
jgi:hypothetical protein